MFFLYMKRGQVTLFIILGILVVALFILGYFLYQQFFFPKEFAEIISLEEERATLEDYVQDCSDTVLLRTTSAVGKQMYLFDLDVTYNALNLPLFSVDGGNTVPDLSSVQREMENVMEEQVLFCVEQFMPTVADSLDVRDVSVDVNLEGETMAVVSVDAFLVSNESRISLGKDITSIVNGSIQDYFTVADLFVDDWIDNNGTICASCVIGYNEKYSVTLSLTPYTDEQLVVLKDENFLVDGVPFEMRFAVENYA